MSFGESFKAFWVGYTDFSGKAPRSEFWWNCLIYLILIFLLTIISFGILGFIYGLVTIIPSLSLSVRRLHDINMSGWWMILFIFLSPAMIVVGLIPSQQPTVQSRTDSNKVYMNGKYQQPKYIKNFHYHNSSDDNEGGGSF